MSDNEPSYTRLAAVDRALMLLPDGSSSADLLTLRRKIASRLWPLGRH